LKAPAVLGGFSLLAARTNRDKEHRSSGEKNVPREIKIRSTRCETFVPRMCFTWPETTYATSLTSKVPKMPADSTCCSVQNPDERQFPFHQNVMLVFPIRHIKDQEKREVPQ